MNYVGQVLARTYRLDRLLVEGGMGTVYQGRHLRTGGACAVKVLHRESAQRPELLERFEDEARIITALRHPHIVQVMDLDHTAEGVPFLVMELLTGEDLQARLDRELMLPLAQVLRLAQQVGGALHAAHLQGVVHRDLKPQNIFLAHYEVEGAVEESAKVVDFGLSKIPRTAERTTRDQLVLGTPRYLCPEGAKGQNSQLDGRADQWSLAVILFRALCGRLPFDGEEIADVLHRVVHEAPPDLTRLMPSVPAAVARVIERALSKSKEDRYPTMHSFVQALLSAQPLAPDAPALSLATPPLLVPTPPPPPPPPGVRALRPVRVALCGLLGALLASPALPLLRGRAALRAQAPLSAQAPSLGSVAAPQVTSAPPEDGAQARRAAREGQILQEQLQQALEARRDGACEDLRLVVGQILQRFPEERGALLLLLPPCQSDPFLAAAAAATLAEATQPARRYPPLRERRGAPSPAPLATSTQGALGALEPLANGEVLERQRQAFTEERDAETIALGHLLASAEPPALRQEAWTLMGLAACNQGDLRLLCQTYDRLDPGHREILLLGCPTAPRE